MVALHKQFRILVIGKDARTDAILDALSRSRWKPILFAFSETMIPGFVEKCEDVLIGKLTDIKRLKEVVAATEPDFVIIGPEEPLAAGFADVLRDQGLPVFGPGRELAKIESSKAWARDLVRQYGIPGNPEYGVFDSTEGLDAYMRELGNFVVKPDGLTGGKGVRVFGEHMDTIEEAVEYASAAIQSDGRVVIEERLEGEEFSLQTITDGVTSIHCPMVQDHKRAREGDQGPNTGGMGSYSCPDFSLPFLDSEDVLQAKKINEQVITALERKTGTKYRGVLYGGFMATSGGVKLIEYNARFGDPEAMNVLPLLRGDFVEMSLAVAQGDLTESLFGFEPMATVCKYIVPKDYPNHGDVSGDITVPPELISSENLRWFWASCEQEGSNVKLTASRSGAVVGIAKTLVEAERLAELGASHVDGPVRHRADIGRTDLVDERVAHMKRLRLSVSLAPDLTDQFTVRT